MKDLISGKRKYVLSNDIKHLTIPQYETLSVKEIKKFITDNADSLLYLPEEQEWEKLPKAWFCNIIHTVITDKFEAWVKARIEARNTSLVT